MDGIHRGILQIDLYIGLINGLMLKAISMAKNNGYLDNQIHYAMNNILWKKTFIIVCFWISDVFWMF